MAAIMESFNRRVAAARGGHTPQAGSQPRPPPGMQMSNCDRCYRRKGKCDKLQPCGSCDRAGVACIYTDRSKERRFTADHVERLEKRIRQAEARNKSLADELSRARSNADAASSGQAVEHSAPWTHSKTPDAVSEVSYLSINAAGERQPYLGSSSGILFADLIRSSVSLSVPVDTTPSNSSPGNSEQNSVVSTTQVATVVRRVEDLPPLALAQRLVQAFLEHENIVYPFIYPFFLLDTLEKVYGEEEYYVTRASPFEVFILNMVLAIATAHVAKFDWQLLPSAESHQVRAFAEMNHVLSHGSVESLQCLLLICIWRTSSSIKDYSASMWHTVGIAVRMTLELGLHRESAYPIKYTIDLEEPALLKYRIQELGRRCFWCVIAMDRIVSYVLGRPLGIGEDDIDAALPVLESDTLLTRPLSSTVAGVSRLAIFNKVVLYRLFCGRLITTLHRRRSPNVSIEDALRIRDELADELDLWYSSLQELRLPENASQESGEQSCYLSTTWYEVLYANATLMIWRPCPLLADITNDRNTLQRIYDSAIHAINTYSILHRSRLINYSWVTLQSVFMAGLSYIYAGHEVFDRLSDAILSDAIKLQTAAAFAQQIKSSGESMASSEDIPAQQTAMGYPVLHQMQQMPRADYVTLWNNSMQQHQAQQSQSLLPQQQHLQQQAHTQLEPHSQRVQQTATPGPSTLAVDQEFLLRSYNDIQTLYHQQRVEDPVMHLSQDWLGYLGAEPAGGYVTNAHLQQAQQAQQTQQAQQSQQPTQHQQHQQHQQHPQNRPFIPSQRTPYQPPHTRM
ncbi:hypothetical protein LTR97_010488 [Elasticomyces elasticus]|uniref:Zn(2)-C6 fungal-type domain-containing protein n=1 Tax=Elasticomyces elasticus TaxID=574655 RepID=A0AAN7ZWM2_9PEZI|nr:hypothetical protein LTR97_010488 [Elasticomyces elasticus]